jgi:hypothetical protein
MKFDLNDLDKMPKELRFILLAMSQSAIYVKDKGKDKEFFLKLAEETWDTVEKNGLEKMAYFTKNAMDQDIKKFMDGFKK